MLPIDVAVDAIMSNADHGECGGVYVYVKDSLDGEIVAESMDELAAKVRSHLQSLVPPPVMLSECEEHKTFNIGYSIPAYRKGLYAYCDDDGCAEMLGMASGFQVIQPVEVPHE